MIQVLFTEDFDAGCKHLIAGGIWIRQFIEDGQNKAVVCCLDKLLLNEFVDPFGLTNIKVDVELIGGGYYLSVAMIKFWGKKLDSVLAWKEQVGASEGSR